MSRALVGEQCVVVLGNVVDGVTICGPFDTPDDAEAWAEVHADDYEDWNVAKLHAPEGVADQRPEPVTWEPTHYSLRDGSLVRCRGFVAGGGVYEVENENGDVIELTATEWLHEWNLV